jgi:hypothetical protein
MILPKMASGAVEIGFAHSPARNPNGPTAEPLELASQKSTENIVLRAGAHGQVSTYACKAIPLQMLRSRTFECYHISVDRCDILHKRRDIVQQSCVPSPRIFRDL